jgi:glycine dehydrogenase
MLSPFVSRHIGLSDADAHDILKLFNHSSLESLMSDIIPAKISNQQPLQITQGLTEEAALAKLKNIMSQNKVYKTYIGQGYYYSHLPAVIQRNLLENPAWYTAYTPYQPEISQGRLEAIMNFQQMIIDLTGMDIANASMLDEGSAMAEAIMMLARAENKNHDFKVLIDRAVLPQSIEVIKTRLDALGIQSIIGDAHQAIDGDFFCVLLQYPAQNHELTGAIIDYQELAKTLNQQNKKIICAADLLALTLLKAPGEWGADAVVGNSQRFGVPVGFGGPHAAYLATKDQYKRHMPGRLVGLSIDSHGKPAYRLALQTREQHIRREKATSNICTAQVLLAVIAGMYAVYHGPIGLKQIAMRVHHYAKAFAAFLTDQGFKLTQTHFFDTICIELDSEKTATAIYQLAISQEINLRSIAPKHLSLSFDETTDIQDILNLAKIFAKHQNDAHIQTSYDKLVKDLDASSASAAQNTLIPSTLVRQSTYLTHPVFNQYHTEHQMLRYLRRLADRDLALDRTMIPLGSCTMKLNATSEMLPVTWPTVNQIHPFVPHDQAKGYHQMIEELERDLSEVTGYHGVSIQPNAGSQGEYAGLLIIQKYHQSRGEGHRNICLIPVSAHGTNPASASMVGMEIILVKCDDQGNVDIADLEQKATEHQKNLAALMITYPSTHGVFEEGVAHICEIIHRFGGQVYIDGANMNALVGTAAPGGFGGDVSHLNLHKTFCIPHGGGGPGVGPVGVAKHLTPFLPNHQTAGFKRSEHGIGAITSSPFGSASILPISWMYIQMMGGDGLTKATQVAILAANYIAYRLKDHYPVLYTGQNGLVAHECIIDIRPLQKTSNISNEDIAKRLMDYGFHAPTMSFPVAGTLMIEPTESESKAELDRFIQAMIDIRDEIRMVEEGKWDATQNPLKQAPHTAQTLLNHEWQNAYSREQAAYGIHGGVVVNQKYWPIVGRIDNVYGDRNLCACLPLDAYENASS